MAIMVWKDTPVFVCLFVLLDLLDKISCKQIFSDSNNDNGTNFVTMSTQTVVAICLSALSFLVVLIVVIIKCTDCYNSEVSTDCHAACGDSGSRKWGGSVHYDSNNTTPGHISFGEVINPNDNQNLPYSMIPTTIPEQGGFQGYNTGDRGDNNPSGPLMGYQNNSSFNGGAPRHYNPAEEQPPPPAYTDALRQSSLHGNR